MLTAVILSFLARPSIFVRKDHNKRIKTHTSGEKRKANILDR
jgi:hypothetical protein